MFKDILIDFVLFSLIECFYYTFFIFILNKKEKDIKIYKILEMAFLNSILYSIINYFNVPFLNIIYTIIFISLYIYLSYNIKLSISLKSMLFAYFIMMVSEVFVSVFYENIFNMTLNVYNKFDVFIILIPSQIIKFLFCILLKVVIDMKGFLGEIKRK